MKHKKTSEVIQTILAKRLSQLSTPHKPPSNEIQESPKQCIPLSQNFQETSFSKRLSNYKNTIDYALKQVNDLIYAISPKKTCLPYRQRRWCSS
jgi:hypothetical protein